MFEKWRIKEHMEVTDAAGRHVGTVDNVDGDLIKLTQGDSTDGRHHMIDLACVDRIADDRVWLKEGVPLPEGLGGVSAVQAGGQKEEFVEPHTSATPEEIAAATSSAPPTGGDAPLFGTSGHDTGKGGWGAV
jgi:hypothetical protein